MPRGSTGNRKIKIQWIIDRATRNATIRKRGATLLEKARELATLCKIPVALVVYGGPGNAEPVYWPELAEAKQIMQKYLDLPEASKEAERLDTEGFLRQRMKKVEKKLENCKATNSALEVNLFLNDISLGRRTNLDNLSPELSGDARALVDTLRNIVDKRVKSLGLVQPEVPPPALEEAVVVALPQQEPPMGANAPLVQPPPLQPEPELLVQPPPLQPEPEPEPEPELLVQPPPLQPEPEPELLVQPPPLAPEQELLAQPPPLQFDLLEQLLPLESELLELRPQLQAELMVKEQELRMLLLQEPSTVPTVVADAPAMHGLPVVEEPHAAAVADVGWNELKGLEDDFPRDGRYLLEVADAIMDDGSGVQATDEDVDRLLWEHGLESFIEPKPM